MAKQEVLIKNDLVKRFLTGDMNAIHRMGNVFLEANDLAPIADMEGFLAGKPVYPHEAEEVPWGMSTEDAIRCLFDSERTARFVREIAKVVSKAKFEHPTEPVTVLEAGGGTGILSIAAALAGADNVTIIEINPQTAQEAQKFINILGLSEKITVLVGDATIFTPPNGEQYDLVISENMHTGLALEPQIQIASHLKQFLKPDGKLVPEGVLLSWQLAYIQGFTSEKGHTELRTIDPATVTHLSPLATTPYIDFAQFEPIHPIKMILPDIHSSAANALVSHMDVVIGSGNVLAANEAQFLGHSHVVRLDEIAGSEGSYLFGHYFPGGKFLRRMERFKSE